MFQVLGSDGIWRLANWTVAGSSASELILAVPNPPPAVSAAATRYAYGNWPIAILFDAETGLPAMPWQRWL